MLGERVQCSPSRGARGDRFIAHLPLWKIRGPVRRQLAGHQHFKLGGFLRKLSPVSVELLLAIRFCRFVRRIADGSWPDQQRGLLSRRRERRDGKWARYGPVLGDQNGRAHRSAVAAPGWGEFRGRQPRRPNGSDLQRRRHRPALGRVHPKTPWAAVYQLGPHGAQILQSRRPTACVTEQERSTTELAPADTHSAGRHRGAA